jgi:hypothetical protein
MSRISTLFSLTLVLTLLAVTPVMAADDSGFVLKTVEEIGENTSTCDFDGDGEFSDYWVTPGQMVLENIVKMDVTDEYIHVKQVVKFDDLEYTLEGAEPSAVYFTTTIISDVFVDLATGIVSMELKSAGVIVDASGNILFRGSWVAATEFVDDTPLWITESGTPGFPCRFGF